MKFCFNIDNGFVGLIKQENEDSIRVFFIKEI